MPELPEVETVRRTLQNFVIHRKIIGCDVYYDKIIEDNTEVFIQNIVNQTIQDIDRIGKYLIFVLDKDAFISHLRMEGKYHIVPTGAPIDKHTHVVFHLDNGEDLRYMDTRKFGRIKISDHDVYHQLPPLNKLGPEPFEATIEEVYPKIHASHLPIKQLLLDQRIMCGIGNIYANEICFRMHLHPKAHGSRLSKKRVQELIEISSQVLNEAIAQGGTTIHSFDSNGIHGLFQVQLAVHGQKICPVCKEKITKEMIGGRGTYYCKKCQSRRY